MVTSSIWACDLKTQLYLQPLVLTLFYDTGDKFWITRKYSVSMHEAI